VTSCVKWWTITASSVPTSASEPSGCGRVSMFVIDPSTGLRVLREADAEELFALTSANRAFLRRWLPWVDLVQSEEDSRSFIATVVAQHKEGRGPTFGVRRDGALVGVIGYLPVDRVNRCGEIGYWLAERAQGRGTMTACCRFVVRYGFLTLDLNRIQIAAGTENRSSRAIPERLGFGFEGILRGRENLNGTFIDHAMYSLLRREFDAAPV
jgi:ribosomal-protein-serine acetyltransferase